MLIWDEIEVMACLDVLPEKDEEYQTWYRFTVPQAGLVLTIEPYTGDVRFCLYGDSLTQPIVEFVLYDTIAPGCVMSMSKSAIGSIISNLPPRLAAVPIRLAGMISYCYGVSA